MPSHMLALEVSGAPAKQKRVEGTYVLTAGINREVAEGGQPPPASTSCRTWPGIDGAWVIDERCTSDGSHHREGAAGAEGEARRPGQACRWMDTDGEIWEEMERGARKPTVRAVEQQVHEAHPPLLRALREHKADRRGDDTDDLDEEMEKWMRRSRLRRRSRNSSIMPRRSAEDLQHDESSVDEDYFLVFFRAYPKLKDNKPSLKPENTQRAALRPPQA